jgi:hypothetical protein
VGDLEAEEGEQPVVEEVPRAARQDMDPVFGYILAMALSVGLTPLQPNARYVALWTFLAVMGGMAFLLGSGMRVKLEKTSDLFWGLFFGTFVGSALILVGYDTLAVTSERLFNDGHKNSLLLDSWVFQATVFVMPLSEALFFRGTMQRVHSLPVVALLASVWSMLMFFPNLGLGDTPIVGVVIGITILVLNFLYSYVYERHGLAASFFCQVIAGSLLLLMPRLM